MERTKQLRYPTTAEIVEFIYERAGLISHNIYLHNKIVELKYPGELVSWFDDTLEWDIASALKDAYENKENLIPVLAKDIPALLLKEQDDIEEEVNVADLVEWHFTRHREVLVLLPDRKLPQGSKHCMSAIMKKELSVLRQKNKRSEVLLNKLKEKQPKVTTKDDTSANEGRNILNEMVRLNKYDGKQSPFPWEKYKIWVQGDTTSQVTPYMNVSCSQEGWHIKVYITNGRLRKIVEKGNRDKYDTFNDVLKMIIEWFALPTTMPGRVGSNKDAAINEWNAINEDEI